MTDKKKITELTKALKAAHEHLNYIGYGDEWERQDWKSLDKKIEAAIKLVEDDKE